MDVSGENRFGPAPEQSLSAQTVEELHELVSCVFDQVITAADKRSLNQLLDQSPAARRYYLKLIAIHSALVTTAGNYARAHAELENGRHESESPILENLVGLPVPASVVREASRFGKRKFRFPVVSAYAAVAVALCYLGIFLWWTSSAELRQGDMFGSSKKVAPSAPGAPAAQPLVAEVTYISPSVRWQDPNASYALASRVRPGQSLLLAYGQVELTYVTGAKLLLTGPAEFVVESAGGKLRRGELVARVPEEGHGFTIKTPHGQVIDLGTEFGVVVDDFGVSQVSVYEGKVETVPHGLANTAQKIQLTSGRALQWTDKAVIPLNAIGRRYQHPDASFAAGMQSTSLAAASLEDDFRGASFSSDWKTIGRVLQTSDGLRLGGGGSTVQRPYFITRQEFDPSQGAITIVCDVRFVGEPDIGDASFAILTRSAQEQSQVGSPWQEMLARFVRCGLKVDPDSGEGMLEAGMKFEPDRELWNNSWGGLSRPKPDTTYRFEMRDDGLNVELTVSLVENPSVRKTISCRSLFRGNHNFVALEGSNSATVVVERLQIFHDRPSNLNGNPIAGTDSQDLPKAGASEAAFFKLLEEMTPRGASLLVEDDFDERELNPSVWAVLGDVALENGQVQLGLPNDESRIDTWEPRPYLLTKQKFSAREGALIIVGKATFAENYLNGYGGSFAVMTRADGSRGNGPGWENSILQRGIRSNFWPAALGFDHSLEIHEKPQPNTISLLTAAGFQINPRSRSYFFCVHDDGSSATLTFVDAVNSRVRKTISHPTSVVAPWEGHIAFESCWGSPVRIDNVRIFRNGHEAKESTRGGNP